MRDVSKRGGYASRRRKQENVPNEGRRDRVEETKQKEKEEEGEKQAERAENGLV